MKKWAKRQYRSLAEAREFVQQVGFRSANEYFDWCSGKAVKSRAKPHDIPSNPHQVYRDEWQGFSDYLGTGRLANYHRKFLPFEEAREFARNLELNSSTEWLAYCGGRLIIEGASPRPHNIPSNPAAVYRFSGWIGMPDWLGYDRVSCRRPSQFLPFEDARDYVWSLKLPSWTEWRRFVRGELPDVGTLPHEIPRTPHSAYAGKGWIDYGDWLGTDSKAYHQLEFRALAEACAFVAALDLKDVQEWRAYCRGDWSHLPPKPLDIPSNPDKAYGDVWCGWGRWFGKEQTSTL